MVIIMHVHLNVFGLELPGYGTAIMIGIVLASLIGGIHIKRRGLDINDFIILETIGVFFGFLGAKLLYLIVSFKDIDWSRLSEPAYLSYVLSAGFVFYGGIILAAVAVFTAGKLNKIDTGRYFREVAFLIPFAHAFGRIGCYFAGCCFGIPYSGPLAVTFPEGSSAPAGISLFPVQLVEAALLFLISGGIYLFQRKRGTKYTVEAYFIAYGLVRFALEFLRWDEYRGRFLFLYTSQWISLLLIAAAIVSIIIRRRSSARQQ